MTGLHLVWIARGHRGALRIGRSPARRQGRTDFARVARLVYVERFQVLGDAIQRERLLKSWERRWLVELVESVNPHWDDLLDSAFG